MVRTGKLHLKPRPDVCKHITVHVEAGALAAVDVPVILVLWDYTRTKLMHTAGLYTRFDHVDSIHAAIAEAGSTVQGVMYCYRAARCPSPDRSRAASC